MSLQTSGPRIGKLPRAVALAGAILAVSGLAACSTTNIEDMAPSASLAPKQLLPAPSAPGKASQVEPAQTAAAQAAASKTPDTTTADAKPADAKAKPAKPAATVASADGAPEDTGTYPNINNVPKGETGQMSPEQRAALMRELAQARGGQKAAGAKPSGLTTVQQMRKLGNQHTKEALKTIVESE